MFLFGITGDMAAGKSWLSKRIIGSCNRPIGHIDTDTLRREVLAEGGLRRELEAHLGCVGAEYVDLARALRADTQAAAEARRILDAAIRERMALCTAQSRIPLFLEWALLVEDGFLPLCSGRLIVVTAPAALRRERLQGADLPDDEIMARFARQAALRHQASGPDVIELDTSARDLEAQVASVLTRVSLWCDTSRSEFKVPCLS